MAKKYIQNCTGDNCDIEGRPKRGDLVSKKISRVIFYVLLTGFVSVTAYVILFSPYLQISNLTVNGVRELSGKDLQQRIEYFLQGKFFGIIPKNNFLFLSQKRVENLLMGDFKKIRGLVVRKEFPGTVSVDIDERKALLVWCSGEKCFLIDENGFAYSEADFNSAELQQNNLLQVKENGGQEVLIGERVINISYEQFILAIKESLTKVGYDTVDQYWTPSRMADEINVRTAQGPELYFSTQFPLESSMRALELIFKKEIPEDKRNELAYIDLRNETKIFYKFKSVEPASENQSSESADDKKEKKEDEKK